MMKLFNINSFIILSSLIIATIALVYFRITMNGHEESFKTINLNDCKDSFSSSNRLVTFELINSRLFDSLSFSARQHYSLDYLEIESKRIAECLKKRADSSRCYSFKADVVHSKEVYREEDMVMKYPHPYHVILNNPDACSSDPQILIGTPVGPRQFLERMGTRHSWGSVRNVDGIRVKHLFFAGQDENDPEGDRLLREENEYYHDIIQFDMKNHFMNLTLLAILTYNWTDYYCPNIQYYVRVDNDMWFNPSSYIKDVLTIQRNYSILGYLIASGRPLRFPSSRYYLPHRVYPKDTFPPYFSGCFVTLTRDVLPVAVNTSATMDSLLYFDDVFLGQVAEKKGIQLLPFNDSKVAFSPVPFIYIHSLWAIHRMSPADRMALWLLR